MCAMCNDQTRVSSIPIALAFQHVFTVGTQTFLLPLDEMDNNNLTDGQAELPPLCSGAQNLFPLKFLKECVHQETPILARFKELQHLLLSAWGLLERSRALEWSVLRLGEAIYRPPLLS